MSKTFSTLFSVIALLLVAFTTPAFPAAAQSYDDCAILPTRLYVGAVAAVEDHNGLDNSLNLPIYDDSLVNEVGSIATYNSDGVTQPMFTILGGGQDGTGTQPRCSYNGYLWWKIRTSDGTVGWVHETVVFPARNGVKTQVYTVKPYTPPVTAPHVNVPLPCPDEVQRTWASIGTGPCNFDNLADRTLCNGQPEVDAYDLQNVKIASFAALNGMTQIDNVSNVVIPPSAESRTLGVALLRLTADDSSPIKMLMFAGAALGSAGSSSSYFLTTSSDTPLCDTAPSGGVIAQNNDSSESTRTITINGVRITFHSTVYLTAVPGLMTVATLEGRPIVSSLGISQSPASGQFVQIPLNRANGPGAAPIGPPTLPQAWNAPQSLMLAAAHMPLRITTAPVGVDAFTAATRLIVNQPSGSTNAVDNVPGDSQYYSFTANAAGDGYSLQLNDYSKKDLPARVTIYPAGQPNTTIFSSNPKTVTYIKLPSAGSYVIVVSPLFPSAALGSYQISLAYSISG